MNPDSIKSATIKLDTNALEEMKANKAKLYCYRLVLELDGIGVVVKSEKVECFGKHAYPRYKIELWIGEVFITNVIEIDDDGIIDKIGEFTVYVENSKHVRVVKGNNMICSSRVSITDAVESARKILDQAITEKDLDLAQDRECRASLG